MADPGDGFRLACIGIARRHDRERYLACLFAPPDRRDALLAVLAANHEIAKTAEVVSEPMIGRIRLQWWRETLDGIDAGRPRVHEVAMPLGEAVRHGLRTDRLRRIVEARESDLDGTPPATLTDLEGYARATAGELHAALAEMLGAEPAVAVASGTAWGLLGVARAAPALIASGRHPLPEELLQNSQLSNEQIRDRPATVKLMPMIEPIVRAALRHLEVAGRMPGFRAPPFRPLRLLADRARDHARSLSAAGFEPASVSAAPPAGLAWRHAGRMLRYRLRL